MSETCGAGVYDDTANVAAYGGPLVAESMHANNAAFVATFDPPTVLAMLNRLEELECRADALAAAAEASARAALSRATGRAGVSDHTPSGQQAVEHLVELFRDWFKSSGVDFWNEANAPEELAEIAMRFRTAAPTTPEAAERARFEAWAKSQHYNLDRDKYGGYASIASHAAWAAWQAALAAQEGAVESTGGADE